MYRHTIKHVPTKIQEKWEVYEWRHASAILSSDFPQEWKDLCEVLEEFSLKKSAILTPGGRKSPIAISVNGKFARRGWQEKNFKVKVVVDNVEHESPTHSVDYFKNRIAIEMEWNNKDPFFDRDLNNFRLLHQLGIISVGVIITRSDELQDIFDELDKGASYGQSTTHMCKLFPRVEGGAAGGCPILVFGITKKLYDSQK